MRLCTAQSSACDRSAGKRRASAFRCSNLRREAEAWCRGLAGRCSRQAGQAPSSATTLSGRRGACRGGPRRRARRNHPTEHAPYGRHLHRDPLAERSAVGGAGNSLAHDLTRIASPDNGAGCLTGRGGAGSFRGIGDKPEVRMQAATAASDQTWSRGWLATNIGRAAPRCRPPPNSAIPDQVVTLTGAALRRARARPNRFASCRRSASMSSRCDSRACNSPTFSTGGRQRLGLTRSP